MVGLLLFLIYVNDICETVPNCKVKLYADDTNVFLFDKDDRNLNNEANLCLHELGTWFKTNKLTLNLDKTCYAVFSVSATDCINLTFDGIDIQKVHTCKYLGIHFDDQLTWRNHIDYIYNKLKQLTGILHRLRSKLADRWLQNIYYAFVYLIYANTCLLYTSPSPRDS